MVFGWINRMCYIVVINLAAFAYEQIADIEAEDPIQGQILRARLDKVLKPLE